MQDLGTITRIAVLAACALPVAAQGKIAWETDLQAALAKAKDANKPLVACFSMAGERVCDVIIAEHYTDPRIVELSRNTINLFCSPHGTEVQRELEKRVRIDLLKKDASTWMVAPQHVVFMPDGELVWAVPYYVTAGELEWMWVQAIRKVRPDFPWEPGDRYRAPRALAAKLTEAKEQQAPPPTQAEIKAMLKQIKRGFGGYYGAREKLPIIVRNEGNQAKTFVERLLRANDTSPAERTAILAIIAANAPRSWWTVCKCVLEDDRESVRFAAVDTMRQLGDKRAAKTLLARWRKDESEKVRGAILQALVACGPTNGKVVKLVPFVLQDYKVEDLRVQAAIAIASLDDKQAVHEGLEAALSDESPRVRSTAAWAIASRRELELLPALQAAAKAEHAGDAKKWLAAGVAVLEGGEMDAFEGFSEVAAR